MINKSDKKKQNHRQNQELLQCLFYSHILLTYNYIIYILDTDPLTNIWNQFIQFRINL